MADHSGPGPKTFQQITPRCRIKIEDIAKIFLERCLNRLRQYINPLG